MLKENITWRIIVEAQGGTVAEPFMGWGGPRPIRKK